MKKYLQLCRVSWQSGLVYRLNFVMWRVRMVLSLLTSYFLWKAIFSAGQRGLFGYTETTMMTYIFVAALVQTVVLSVRSIDLAGVITSGDLSNIMIRPVSNFWYWFSRDVADKLLNIFFSLGELVVLFFLLKPHVLFPSSSLFLLFLLVLLFSTFLYYLINYLFGLVGFWSPDVWAPRFFLFIVLQFTAGQLFPLDVLPQNIQRLIALTPFPSLVFLPTQIFLGRLGSAETIQSLLVALVWILVFAIIVRVVWRRGLRRYAAEGR